MNDNSAVCLSSLIDDKGGYDDDKGDYDQET
jgi:hypothetical protein